MFQILWITLTIGCVFSAELPRDAQRELDTFEVSLNKADAERQAKVDAAVDKAVKALDAISRKAATAEDRRAIDDKILELKEKRSKVDDLLGDKKNPKAVFVGSFTNQRGQPWGVLYADGTSKHHMVGVPGTWEIVDGKCVATWTGTSYVDTITPPDKDGVFLGKNNRGEIWTMTKNKNKDKEEK